MLRKEFPIPNVVNREKFNSPDWIQHVNKHQYWNFLCNKALIMFESGYRHGYCTRKKTAYTSAFHSFLFPPRKYRGTVITMSDVFLSITISQYNKALISTYSKNLNQMSHEWLTVLSNLPNRVVLLSVNHWCCLHCTEPLGRKQYNNEALTVWRT